MVNEYVYVVDIETDHLKYEIGSIVEIGISKFNFETKKISPVFNSIFNGRYIDQDAWIFKNSSLSYKEVKMASDLSELTENLQYLFSNNFFTAFNQKFDFGWLEHFGFSIPFKWLDPMLFLVPVMKIRHYYYGYKYPSVVEAYFFLFNEKLKESHRALDDALVEAKIIKKMCEKSYFYQGPR